MRATLHGRECRHRVGVAKGGRPLLEPKIREVLDPGNHLSHVN